MSNPFDWAFLNEPLWRWFLFLVAIGFIMGAWGFVLTHMKAAV